MNDYYDFINDIKSGDIFSKKYSIKLSEIIKKQTILNIGCIRHVGHGKLSVIKSIT